MPLVYNFLNDGSPPLILLLRQWNWRQVELHASNHPHNLGRVGLREANPLRIRRWKRNFQDGSIAIKCADYRFVNFRFAEHPLQPIAGADAGAASAANQRRD
jgi:hypothetical protein